MLRRTTPSCVRPRTRSYTAKAQEPKEGGDGTQGKPRIHHRIKQWATKIADKETAAVVKRRVTEAGSQATQASTAALKSVAGLLEPIRKRAGVHSEQWFKTLVDRTVEGVREAAWYQSQKEQSIEWLKALYGGIEGKAHQSIDQIGPLLRLNHNRKFYEKGWGNREVITYMYDMIDKPKVFLDSNRPRQLDIKWVREEFKPECLVADGKFEAPLARFLPLESQTAHFRIIVPRQGKDPVFTTDALTSTMRNRPRMCILLGGTGDHGFGLRQTFFAKRLLKYNIGSIILENPFYGSRKPKDQSGSCLLHVSDIMLLGSSIIVEANALADWLESEGRYGGVGFAGMSMGGINSCLAAAVGNRPLALAPLIAPYSAGPVFTKGVISKVCDWDTLTKQLPEYAPPNVKTAPEFMLKLLDDLTDLRNYPVPRHPEFAVQVRAKHDMYVPEGYDLREFWPGSEVRHVSAGHISAVAMGFLPQFDVFNSAIVDSFDKLDAYRRREGLPTAASA